jgi:hypothetical protein
VELSSTGLTAGVRQAYGLAAPRWAEGPEPVYASLARVLASQVEGEREAAVTGTGPLLVDMLVLTAR